MPAEFDLGAVEEELRGTRFAGCVTHLQTIGSTNQVALEAALGGARAGVWVADEQTAGRGRGGHRWHSAASDGLYVSALVTPRVPLEKAPWIALATGLAVQAAVAAVAGATMDLRGPNDLMFGARKAGGILVESVSGAEPGGGELRYAVVGIGVNVGQTEFPEELRDLATSLSLESGRVPTREQLLGAMLRELEEELQRLEQELEGLEHEPERPERGAAGLLERFAAASSWVHGKQVKVDEEGGYTGWTCGLDARGFLRVKEAGGTVRTVRSGGVRPF